MLSRSIRRTFSAVHSQGWVVILAASLALNVYLVARSAQVTGIQELQLGSTLPELKLTELTSGEVVAVDFRHPGTKQTVLYWFQPTCPWCAGNDTNLTALRSCLDREGYDFVAISPTEQGVAEYLSKRSQGYEVFVDHNREFIAAAGLMGTPSTLVLSPSATIVAAWRGAWTGGIADELTEYFDCTLPGLSEPKLETTQGYATAEETAS